MTDSERGHTEFYEQTEFALEVTNSVIWAIDLETGEPTTLRGGVESLFQIPSETVETIESFFEAAVHPDDRPRLEQTYREIVAGQTRDLDVEFRLPSDRDSVTWIHSHGRVQDDSDSRLLTGISTDITDRKRREQAIQELHHTTHAIWEAESPKTVAEIVVTAVCDILDMPANAVYLYDDDEDCLRPIAVADRARELAD